MTLRTPANRAELLQGTLDMLILRTLLFGAAHGHQIAKHIQRTTQDVLQVEHVCNGGASTTDASAHAAVRRSMHR